LLPSYFIWGPEMSIIPIEKLEQLRREQRAEEHEEHRPRLYAPEPEPLQNNMSSGSTDVNDDERGVTIIDFTV